MKHRGFALGIGAALSLLAAGSAPGAGTDPHEFMADGARCVRCHVEVPRRGASAAGMRFQKDFVSLCLECHREKDLAALHPVDIRPSGQVPEYLPLDDHGTMTCVTCHAPHAEAESGVPHVAESLSKRLLLLLTPKRRHRTFYLRRRNDRGQLCLACHKRSILATDGFHVNEASILHRYAGSEACGSCHREAYATWKKTPHARMTRDARRFPETVLADFSGTPPFPRSHVVWALGSHWTQRYVVQKGDKLVVKAAIWSILAKKWDTSYWVDKPWAQYCQGCHTTGFEMREQPRFAEAGVGCEACHGPGRAHAESGGTAAVVNPAKLDPERRDMVCEACHTTGHDRSGQFRFPLGFLPGKDLGHFYKGLLPKPGQDNQTFVGDESREDRHRQWQFLVQAFMDAKGLACEVCKNFRSELDRTEKLRMTPSEYCLSCHQADWPEDALHTRHLKQDVHCHRCHVPATDRERKRYSIHDHKFLFLAPEGPPAASPHRACPQCHGPVAASQR